MNDSRRYNRQFRPEFSRLHLDRDLRWVVPFAVRYVVCVTGTRFAGKSTALAYLTEKHNFEVYSLAAVLREAAVQLGVPLEPRYRLQDLGDELRAHYRDPAHLARLTLRKIHRDHIDQRSTVEPLNRIAVGGFKRPEELALFEALDRFAHFNVTAKSEICFERARDSGVMERELRHIEPPPAMTMESFEQYIARRDLTGNDNIWTAGYGQAVGHLVQSSATVPILNEDRIADLDDVLDAQVKRLDARFRAFAR